MAACGDDSASTTTTNGETTTEASGPPMMEVGATETASGDAVTYGFDLPDDVTAGQVQLNLTNKGEEEHQAQIFKLNDGADPDSLKAKLIANDIGGALAFGAFNGGTGGTSAGSSSEADALVDVQEGTYAIICFLPDAKGTPHLVNGMFDTFEVGPAKGSPQEQPTADATVKGVNFAYTGDNPPGHGIVQFTNESADKPHEANILKLAPGKTIDDAAKWDGTGEPPYTAVGGMQAVLPGAGQRMALDLDSGSYVLICGIPDDDGVPHFQKGMVKPFTVP